MSRRDRFHEAVRHALEKDGWIITHDPLPLAVGSLRLEVDLGAERLIIAQRESQKIAVEVKSFLRTSKITDFYSAFGQLLPYKVALRRLDPDREVYLAVPEAAYNDLFGEILIQDILQEYPVKIIVYSPEQEEITAWIA